MKMLQLNSKGFTHHFAIMLFVVVFAIIGAGYIVASHADTTYTSTSEWSKFQYIKGSGVTTDLTHSQTGKLLLQFNSKVTTYHATDMAMYKLVLPTNTAAKSITFNASYINGGYNTVFLAAGSPSNIIWKVNTAANVSNRNISLSLPNNPTSIYFGITATGSAGGYGGTFPANRYLQINSYTLNGTTTTTDSGGSGGTGGSTGGGSSTGGSATSGSGTLIFEGTFDSNLTNYSDKIHYYNPAAVSIINSRQLKFHVTSADSLSGNEGHYRADLGTKNIYQGGVPTCTTVPVQFPDGLATVPHNSWLQFAELKPPSVDYQGWNMGVSSWYNGYVNSFTIGFQGFAGNGSNLGSPAWVSPPMDNKVHTFSVCTNNASDNSGTIYSVWMDGVRQTFNQGAAKGKQSLSGFPIIKNASAYPLIINDYTGGSPVPNTLIHGAPLVTKITGSTNDTPPMPAGGWNSLGN